MTTDEITLMGERLKGGKTLREIGDEFGISGERVRQILSDRMPEYAYYVARNNATRMRYGETRIYKCWACKADVPVPVEHRKPHDPHLRTYCDGCRGKWRRKYPVGSCRRCGETDKGELRKAGFVAGVQVHMCARCCRSQYLRYRKPKTKVDAREEVQ